MRTLSVIGWIVVAIDLIAAVALYLDRGGDAATRGLGQGLGVVMAGLAAVSAFLLWVGRGSGRAGFGAVGTLLAAAPWVFALALGLKRNGLALIYPSLRDPDVPRQPVPQYAFPDAASRAAAMAIVMNDYARLETLLRATPAPDLAAHDELGRSLLGLAITAAIMDGGSVRDLDGLKFLLAAGARPRPDDLGPGESVMERVAGNRNDRQPLVLKLLLEAGLDPNSPLADPGRPVLFHPDLAPEAARLLLAHGVATGARMTTGGRDDWSPLVYQADLRRWETAAVLLEGRVPPDHGTPPGSVLARVLGNIERGMSDQDRADPAWRKFRTAVGRP